MKVKELTYLVLKYKKYYWYNVKYGSCLGLSAIVVFMIMENTYIHIYSVFIITGMLIIGIAYMFPRAKKHAQRIKEIEQGLAELKTFESTD